MQNGPHELLGSVSTEEREALLSNDPPPPVTDRAQVRNNKFLKAGKKIAEAIIVAVLVVILLGFSLIVLYTHIISSQH